MEIGANTERIKEIWAQVVDRTKQTVISPALWRALDHTVAITQEGDQFVVGTASADGQMVSQLNTGEYKVAMERILRAATGNENVRMRLIDGSDFSDWTYAKARDAAVKAKLQQATQKQEVETAASSTWDELHDQAARLYANSEFRALASGRARYLEAALTLIVNALPSVYPDWQKTPNDLAERGLTRVLERIASNAQTDPVTVGYLLFLKARG